MTQFLPITQSSQLTRIQVATGDVARQTAEKLEATFLSEMLKSAGLGTQSNSMSGGIGEDQFASFHRQALADELVASGGIGLAEMIHKSMMERAHD